MRDWLFGSAAKRLLIAAFLAEPDRRWTKYALAKHIGVDTHGALDQHLVALKQMRLVSYRRGAWQLASGSRLETPLRMLLDEVEQLPDRPLQRP